MFSWYSQWRGRSRPARTMFYASSWLMMLWFFSMITIGTDAFLCDGCECTDTSTVSTPSLIMNCSRLNFTDVPEFLARAENYTNVTQLYLDNNFIREVRQGDFRALKSISTLSLKYNGLSFIGNDTFYGMELHKLDLSCNNLSVSSFEPYAFRSQGKISLLVLSHNNIRYPPRQLSQLQILLELDLSHNPMNPILKSDSFDGFSDRIIIIDLSDCGLTLLEPNTFSSQKFSYMTSLFLDSNHFEEIDSNFFKGASIRHKLSLQNCGIRQMKKLTFKELGSLQSLHLNGNNLANQKERNVFAGLRIASALELKDCNLQFLKRGFLRTTIYSRLDLSGNNISRLEEDTFKDLESVKEIKLNDNNINLIKGQPFNVLLDLKELYLENNALTDDSINFVGTSRLLHTLDISYNHFNHLPNMQNLSNLHTLYAAYNDLRSIDQGAFINNSLLETLQLTANRNLSTMSEDIFDESSNLNVLDVSFSSLVKLPRFKKLQNLQQLNLAHSSIRELPADLCETSPKLKTLYADHNFIERIPDLSKCKELTMLYLDFNDIRNITNTTFRGMKYLEEILLQYNKIDYIHPEAFHGLESLRYLHLSNNKIPGLPENFFQNLTLLQTLNLERNRITRLPRNIFKDLVFLETLDISSNNINFIADVIFPPNMTWLQFLYVSNNSAITHFPVPHHGFPFLHTLTMENLPKLIDVPSVTQIPRIQVVNFTYPYHCCIFKDYIPEALLVSIKLPADENSPTKDPDLLFTIVRPQSEPLTLPPHVIEGNLFPGRIDPFNPGDHDVSPEEFLEELITFAEQWNVTLNVKPNDEIEIISHKNGTDVVVGTGNKILIEYLRSVLPTFTVGQQVQCLPLPNPLSPCENLLDPQPLPVLVWVIWFTAVFGNIAVLFVMFVSKEKIEVPQFFICNLAFADFLLGIYLAFLGVVDIRTRGQSFYKSALHWQMGIGCQSAGFLAIFSSELSVFILVVMTLERVHTIAYSFGQNTRLKMRYAIAFVVIGWMLAGTLATLPLLDVNTYSDVAICLPFRTDNIRDKVFIALVLSLNLIGFLIILCSYVHILRIYCKSPAAKRGMSEKMSASFKMAVLVLANLICWLPLAIVGFAAVADTYLIDLSVAKFFIILIFPFDACLNPFLYAIFTKQFWQRVKSICKRSKKLQSINPNSLKISFRRNSIASGSDTGSGLRTHSPRGDIDYDLVARRQSRRSFSVQLETPHSIQLPTTSAGPGPGPAPYLGRRFSSPAIFSADPSNGGFSGRPINFRIPSNPTLPDLREETELDVESSPQSLTSSPGTLHRTPSKCLSIVHEEISDCDSDGEENQHEGPSPPIIPPLPNSESIQRHLSDLDISNLQRLSIKDLVSRNHQVADKELDTCDQNRLDSSDSSNYEGLTPSSSSPCHTTPQLTHTILLGSSNEMNTPSNDNRLSSDSTSVCITNGKIININPYVSKPSRHCEETPV